MRQEKDGLPENVSGDKALRVLHVLFSMNRGGAEAMLMNYFRNIDREKVRFDFLLAYQETNDYEEEIYQLGGRIYRTAPLTATGFFQYIKSVNTFFKRHTYAIVHAHVSSYGSIALFLAKKHQTRVRICHSHNASSGSGIKGLLRSIPQFFFVQQGTDFFSCGKEAADWLYGTAFCKQKEIRILNNAIDVKNYTYHVGVRNEIRRLLSIKDEAVVVGHVGRFNRQKNHDFLLDIFQSVKKQCNEAILLLIGDGILRSRIEKKAEDMGLADSVIFTGVVSNVPDYLQAMDIFLFPSLFEGLSVALIEAQAAGLKIITSTTVDGETSLTDLITYIPLEKPASEWAREVLEIGNVYERRDTFNEIEKACYDIKSQSKWLETFYLSKNN